MKAEKKHLLFLAVFILSFFLLPNGVGECKKGTSMMARAESVISIDANKKYEGMPSSFAKGYVPSITNHTMYLVVPFSVEAPLEHDCLTVGISFEQAENSPFYFKNYQKKVKKSEDGIYLYQCRIKLRKDRVNGQYPLYLNVLAQTAEGNLEQTFTIYAEITDGKEISAAGAWDEEPMPQEEQQETVSDAAEPKEEISHQPRVMITQNSLQGTDVKAGSSIPWTLAAKNLSNSQPVENLKVTLLSENKDISYEKVSWYFEKANAGMAMDLSQKITVSKKAVAEPVSIQFQFDYEDKNGTGYSSTETVYLSVSQVQQAELVNLSFPESIYESDTESLVFQALNTGLAVIYNVKVRLEGKGLFASREVFLGNMEAGTSQDGELDVFAGTLNMDAEGNIDESAEKYGDTTAIVIFSYENEQGEITEQRQEFVTAIKKPEIVELDVENEEPETNQWWITIVAIIILVLVLIIFWLYLRMKYYQRIKVEMYEKT